MNGGSIAFNLKILRLIDWAHHVVKMAWQRFIVDPVIGFEILVLGT